MSPPDPVLFFQRRRPLFWLSLAFCAGIGCDHFLAPGLPALGGFCLAVMVSSLALLILYRDHAGKMPAPQLAAIAFALTGGMLIHALCARIPSPDDISRRTSSQPSFVLLRGTIVAATRPEPVAFAPPDTASRATWTVDVDALGGDEQSLLPASGQVRLSVLQAESGESRTVESCAEGDKVVLRARLEAPPEVTLPGGFDYAGWLRNQGIRRSGVVFPGAVRRVSGPAWWQPQYFLRRLSSTLAARVETLLPQPDGSSSESSQAALLNALLFGRREHLAASDRESFAVSGAAHLLAISGLQIQFLAWLLWRVAGWVGLSKRKSAWLVLVLSCAYCALAGGDAPIFRATIMIALYLGAVLCWREPDPLSTLAAAALAILAVSPAELFDAGFQLSFAAVLALLTVYPSLEEAWASWRNLSMPEPLRDIADKISKPVAATALGIGSSFSGGQINTIRQCLFVSLAAWLGTAPIVAWHMGRFATLSLLVNLIAVPLGSLCMVCGLVMLFASLFSTALGALLGWLAWAALALLQGVNSAAAALPFANIDLPAPAVPVLVVYAGLLVPQQN